MRAEPITPASGSLRAPSPAPQTDRNKSTLPGVVRPLMSSPFSEAIPHTLHLSTLLGSSELNCEIRVIGAVPPPTHTHLHCLAPGRSQQVLIYSESSAGAQSQHSGGRVRKSSVSLRSQALECQKCPRVQSSSGSAQALAKVYCTSPR